MVMLQSLSGAILESLVHLVVKLFSLLTVNGVSPGPGFARPAFIGDLFILIFHFECELLLTFFKLLRVWQIYHGYYRSCQQNQQDYGNTQDNQRYKVKARENRLCRCWYMPEMSWRCRRYLGSYRGLKLYTLL